MNEVVYEMFMYLIGLLPDYNRVNGSVQFYLKIDANQDTRAGFECQVVDGVEFLNMPIISQVFSTCKEELGMRKFVRGVNAPVFYLLPGDYIRIEDLTSHEFIRLLVVEPCRRKLRLLAA